MCGVSPQPGTAQQGRGLLLQRPGVWLQGTRTSWWVWASPFWIPEHLVLHPTPPNHFRTEHSGHQHPKGGPSLLLLSGETCFWLPEDALTPPPALASVPACAVTVGQA